MGMPDDLKNRVLEIVSIVKECPDNLQPLCLELLLRDYLEGRHRPTCRRTPHPPAPTKDQPDEHLAAGETGQQDLKAGDLHMKARKFMERYSISLDHLNQLFYRDDREIKPLYEDLKTTRMAESQIRVALLHTLPRPRGRTRAPLRASPDGGALRLLQTLSWSHRIAADGGASMKCRGFDLDMFLRVGMVVQEHALASGDEPVGDFERLDQTSLHRDRRDRLGAPRLPTDVVVARDSDHDDVAEFRRSDALSAGLLPLENSVDHRVCGEMFRRGHGLLGTARRPVPWPARHMRINASGGIRFRRVAVPLSLQRHDHLDGVFFDLPQMLESGINLNQTAVVVTLVEHIRRNLSQLSNHVCTDLHTFGLRP